MSIIPEEELKRYGNINLAPMVDFLFLVVAVFATLAVTRAALYDEEIKLVKVKPLSDQSTTKAAQDTYIINLSVDQDGHYKWITEFNEYMISSVADIQQELHKQQDLGLLPKDNAQTKVLLHIEKTAQWEPIAQLIFGIKQSGFEIHPVYDVDDADL